MGKAGLRWGEDDEFAPILHVDMDAFFASVELTSRPGLRGRPMVVAGRERGVVLAATYEARAFGIHSGMPTASALARFPSLVVIPPDHDRYRTVSRAVMAVLHEITPAVQQLSVDEAFLDVSGARRRLGTPMEIGASIRRRIRDEIGLPASVGIAATLMTAKIASGRAKPDGMLLVPASATVDFLHSLPVTALWGVGASTEQRLAQGGVRTIAELAAMPLPALAGMLGAVGAQRLHDLAWGRDPRRVEPSRTEKSISTEHTFAEDVRDRATLERTALDQTHQVARRLRAGSMLARGVTIKVRHGDFTTLTRSRKLQVPSDLALDLYAVVRELLAGVAIPRSGIRLLGVRADELVAGEGTPIQEVLGADRASARAVEAALDDVSRKFGARAAVAASLLRRSGSDETSAGDLS